MTVGSLFAGIGGIDLGFKQAGFNIIWANEIDKDACKTYRLNFPETTLFEGDVHNLEESLLPKVDIITAGFPCQSFSVCGNQKGFEDIKNMIQEFRKEVQVRVDKCGKPTRVLQMNLALFPVAFNKKK